MPAVSTALWNLLRRCSVRKRLSCLSVVTRDLPYGVRLFAVSAYDVSTVGIDVMSVHKLFAYKVMSTARIDVESGHMKYSKANMVSRCTMH